MTERTKVPNPTLRQVAAHLYGFDGGAHATVSTYLFTMTLAALALVWVEGLVSHTLTMEWSIVLVVLFTLFALLMRWKFYAARLCLLGLCPICEEEKHEWRH